jgi:hypothetical protein
MRRKRATTAANTTDELGGLQDSLGNYWSQLPIWELAFKLDIIAITESSLHFRTFYLHRKTSEISCHLIAC